MKKRYLQDQVESDLKNKMVFVSGPKQVGKTTLAKSLITDSVSYLNWDIPTHREIILKRELLLTAFWCFDEFHNDHRIMVTGSARLDMLRKSGDSLQGRYHHLRLHPLSIKELGITKEKLIFV